MSDINLEHYKELLQRKERGLGYIIRSMKQYDTASQDKYSPTELSNYDNHPAEIASELFQLELNTALKVHEEDLLKDIHDALGRIYDGTYGKCTFCGEKINEERLEAIPYARLCIKCEENKDVDPKILKNMRPIEEMIWDAPMGRKYLNKREDDEHEGMDQFNDLMKYGSADSPQDLGGYNDYEEFYTNKIDKQGVVDDIDQISNNEYKRQLPN